MAYISLIFVDVIVPLLILLGIGVLLQKKFEFRLRPIANLLTYCFLPSAVFLNLYEAEIDAGLLGQLVVYLALFVLVIALFGEWLSRFLGLAGGEQTALKNSISLMNSGNYGLPVSQLAFSANPVGVSVQIIVLVVQNLLTFTYGLYNLRSSSKSLVEVMRELLRLPVIYALAAAFILKMFQAEVPRFIMVPIEQLAGGFAALALLLLGMQLAQIEIRSFHRVIAWSALGRLIVGPAVALLLIMLLGIDGVIAQSLFIASAFPTSRNTATLALEYDVEPELHAQVVLYSTILSSITVTFVIYLSMQLF
ncbi:AEC family transporter [Salinicoccus sp. ID82-1]|uniref:AEC family transporter n=1 Tax=Salinicoccus sp. ID82-1 TaxID=2820269 RepID=UPI001F030AF6|nr:AEC family transporter [Salinicoccus sp. ID82-1]MCG1008523.1 AEC family transporter [Salinicoccus sp. ID82-1]